MRILFWLTVFFIIYGSLYPFSFRSVDRSVMDLILLRQAAGRTGLSDLLGNIILFIPYGFFGTFAFLQQKGRAHTIIRLLIGGLFLAYIVQVIQVYIPARSPSMMDVVYNIVGLLAGMAAFPFASKLTAGREAQLPDILSAPLILLIVWMAAMLGPFVPTLDVGLVFSNVKLLLSPSGILLAAVTTGTLWLFAFILVDRLLADPLPLKLRILAVGAVSMAQMVIVNSNLSLGGIIGAITASLLVTHSRIGQKIRDPQILAALALVILLLNGLAPFSFAVEANSFSFIPFEGALGGNMARNIVALAEKTFLYGTALWFLKELGSRRTGATLLVFLIVLLVEFAQIFIVSRGPEITDPLIVIGLAILLKRLPEPKAVFKLPGISAPVPEPDYDQPPEKIKPFDNRQMAGALIPAFVMVAGIMIGAYLTLQLPNIPYNVRELFTHGGSLVDLFLFTFAVCSLGAAGYFSGIFLKRAKRPVMVLPLLLFGAAMVFYLPLWLAVTDESLSDIAGSSNIYWFVINRDIWGEFAREVFTVLDTPGLIGFAERLVRFTALIAPLLLCLILFHTWRLVKTNRPGIWTLAITSLFWFWLAKWVTFDHSSTDNLNELFEPYHPFGLGGGVYLYLLIILISGISVQLCYAERRRLIVNGLLLLLSLPIGWLLLKNGLSESVEKYGQTFSGIDFLLGPDRVNKIAEAELFARWCFVQLAGILILSISARTARSICTMRHGELRDSGLRKTGASVT